MSDDIDFSGGRRDAVDQSALSKTRITIRLDNEILAWFRAQVHQQGGGNYQRLINDALLAHIREQKEPLEATLWRVIREELTGNGKQ